MNHRKKMQSSKRSTSCKSKITTRKYKISRRKSLRSKKPSLYRKNNPKPSNQYFLINISDDLHSNILKQKSPCHIDQRPDKNQHIEPNSQWPKVKTHGATHSKRQVKCAGLNKKRLENYFGIVQCHKKTTCFDWYFEKTKSSCYRIDCL